MLAHCVVLLLVMFVLLESGCDGGASASRPNWDSYNYAPADNDDAYTPPRGYGSQCEAGDVFGCN